jgi:small-conductance mechanosensitive channel
MHPMKRIFYLLLPILLWTAPDLRLAPGISKAYAQGGLVEFLEGKKENKEAPPLADIIQEKKALASQELRDVQKSLDGLAVSASPAQAKNLKDRKTLLEELSLYYEQILEAQSRSAALGKEAQELQENLDAWSQPETPKILDPNFELLDGFSGHFQMTSNRLKASIRSLDTIRINLEEAKQEVKNSEKERRRIKEQVEVTHEPSLKVSLQNQLALLEIRSRIAEADATLLSLDLKNEKDLQRNLELESRLISRKVDWLKKHVQFTQQELDAEIERIEIEKEQLTQALQDAKKNLRDFESQWAIQQEKLSPAASEAFEAEQDAIQDRIAILAQRFQRLGEWERAWQRRYQVFNQSAKKTVLTDWQDETTAAIDQAQRQETLTNINISKIREDLQDIEQKIAATGDSNSELQKLRISLRDQYQALLTENENFLSSLAQESQLYQKLLSEIAPQVERFDLREKLALVWNKVVRVWNFELTSIDDRPITVKKLCLVLILLLLGFFFSRRISRWMERKLFPRLGLKEGAAAGLQTLVFYVLTIATTLLVLYLVNVPLTLFTVLGGALAIGVGIGSQNIVKNFIGGLILLIEQPIKIGDLVGIDGTKGIVEHIGARSTRIRKANNVHVIVPNNDLLEKNVINWTLSDDLVRITVSVGVAYGSSTREVAKLIRLAVDEHGKVIPQPEPIVLFKNFGDNALIFVVHFWINMRSGMDEDKIASDIRYRIDSLFREAGIGIPFPQRDVHLNALSPLEVKILPEEKQKAEG